MLQPGGREVSIVGFGSGESSATRALAPGMIPTSALITEHYKGDPASPGSACPLRPCLE